MSVGDEVKAMITDVDFEKHRISLSIKAVLEEDNIIDSAENSEKQVANSNNE